MEPVILSFHGFEKMESALTRLGGDARKVTNELVADFVRERRKELEEKEYPPERPGQRYVRTYNLKRSYQVFPEGGGDWLMVNQARYSEYVVGDEDQQAWMHVGRWWTMRDVIEEAIPALSGSLAARYQDAIDEAIG